MTEGTSLVVQGLGLCASITGGASSIPGQGTKILSATRGSQKKKKRWMTEWVVDKDTSCIILAERFITIHQDLSLIHSFNKYLLII